MTDIQPAIKNEVAIHYKRRGDLKVERAASISDAIQHAVNFLDSGYAIPKSITIDGREVYSEADINTHWESQKHGRCP